jgi:Bacterial Ig domain
MRIYVDGTMEYQATGNTVSKNLPVAGGSHTVTVQATDEAGGIVKTAFKINVAKPSVTILKPSNGQGAYSPVDVWGVAQAPNHVHTVQVYVDDGLKYEMTGTGLTAPIPMSFGPHHVVLQACDAVGGIYKSGVNINVLPLKVTVSSPLANATVSSPVHIHASTPSNSTVFSIQVYVDDGPKYQANGTSIDTNLSMSPGQHHIVAQAWDNGGGTWKSGVYVTVK